MTANRVVTGIVATVVGILAAACGSGTAQGGNQPPPRPSTPAGSPGSTINVTLAVDGSHCPPVREGAGPGMTIDAASISMLIVCPQLVLNQNGRARRLTEGQAGFAALLQQITRPSDPRKPDQMCPMFALPPEYVLALAAGKWYVVQLPTDACGHYRGALLALLNRLRS